MIDAALVSPLAALRETVELSLGPEHSAPDLHSVWINFESDASASIRDIIANFVTQVTNGGGSMASPGSETTVTHTGSSQPTTRSSELSSPRELSSQLEQDYPGFMRAQDGDLARRGHPGMLITYGANIMSHGIEGMLETSDLQEERDPAHVEPVEDGTDYGQVTGSPPFEAQLDAVPSLASFQGSHYGPNPFYDLQQQTMSSDLNGQYPSMVDLDTDGALFPQLSSYWQP